MNSPTPGYIVCGLGTVLIVIALFWAAVIGYYPSDLPALLGLVLVGAGMAWGGQRMFQAAKRQNVEHEIAQRDAAEG